VFHVPAVVLIASKARASRKSRQIAHRRAHDLRRTPLARMLCASEVLLLHDGQAVAHSDEVCQLLEP
jgi:hypothetical protein